MNGFVTERNGKAYVTARAQIVSDPEELAREYAFAMSEEKLNPAFLWISGRYVQGEKANRNGQFWTTSDLKNSEYSIKYTPLNVLHESEAVGVFVETKLVHREAAAGESELLPEIQALSALWAHNYPQIADAARAAHEKGQLWYSMECVGEAKQCLTCNRTFEWSAATFCEHMESSATSPRRLINPLFQGGALIFPPTKPGWDEAEIEEVANATNEYADRNDHDAREYEALRFLMHQVGSK
jgi:hypothetical protein